MKKNYLYLLLITCIALFASCRDDKEYTYEPGKNIIFNGSLPQGAETRVNATTWDKDDQVGIYMIGNLASFDVLDGADNKKFHTPNGDGVFWHYDNLNTIRFPEGRGNVDFVSYHPYQSDIKEFVYSINISSQSSQSAIDLLYSKNATGVTKDVVPSLIFDHQLTKLVFNIVGAGGLSDLDGLQVTLSDLPTKGTFNLVDGTLTTLEGTSDVVMKTTIDSKDLLKATVEGIVIPTSAAKRVLTFTLNVDGASKSFDIDASSYVFEAGKKNKYDVTLDAKLGAIIKPTSTITPWEDGSSEVIDVDVSGDDKKETVIFNETFGAGAKDAANKWITVADYQDYSAKNMTYSDPYGTASSIRNLNGVANIWLPANKESGFKIEGIPANQTGLVLTYQILSNSKTDLKTADIIQVKAGTTVVTVPKTELSFENWTTITLDIPDNTTSLEFYSSVADNTVGIRVANVKLVSKGGSVVPEVPVTDGVIFNETFGAGAKDATNKWITVADYQDYSAKNMTYSDPYGTASSIRNLNGKANIWLPANKESGFKIEGIPTNQTGLVLTYEILTNSRTDINTADIIQVKAGTTSITVPKTELSFENWTTITLNIPDNTTSIEFYSATAQNNVGIRVANIKLVTGDTTPSVPEVPKTKGIIFTENFGGGIKGATGWLSVENYTEYSAKNVTYSDPYTGNWASIRNLKDVGNVWLPAFATDKESGFKIDGIASGYSEMQLEYQILGQNPTKSDVIQVKCNGTIVNVTPIDVNNLTWSTIIVDIPDNTTNIEFYSGSANTIGIRIANIKLQGAK